jgi:hypothetical protein
MMGHVTGGDIIGCLNSPLTVLVMVVARLPCDVALSGVFVSSLPLLPHDALSQHDGKLLSPEIIYLHCTSLYN